MLNNDDVSSHILTRNPSIPNTRRCSKKLVQLGHRQFRARSVLAIREHGKLARTPLAAFFNSASVINKQGFKGTL